MFEYEADATDVPRTLRERDECGAGAETRGAAHHGEAARSARNAAASVAVRKSLGNIGAQFSGSKRNLLLTI